MMLIVRSTRVIYVMYMFERQSKQLTDLIGNILPVLSFLIRRFWSPQIPNQYDTSPVHNAHRFMLSVHLLTKTGDRTQNARLSFQDANHWAILENTCKSNRTIFYIISNKYLLNNNKRFGCTLCSHTEY